MNKYLIKKYQDVFSHWLNDGKILVKRDGFWFDPNNENLKNCTMVKSFKVWETDAIYIKNDEYVKFRKVLVEGGTIEFYAGCEWTEISSSSFRYDITRYRLKEEKPKFKIGDWIRRTGYPDIVFQVNAITETHVHSNTSEHYTIEGVELWDPEEGELCVFWNVVENPLPFIVGRFKEKIQHSYGIEFYTTTTKDSFDRIAPIEYLNTLNRIQL